MTNRLYSDSVRPAISAGLAVLEVPFVYFVEQDLLLLQPDLVFDQQIQEPLPVDERDRRGALE